MVDVIVYKPLPYGLVFIHDKPLGLRPRVYHPSDHTKHERVYVSYNINHTLFNISLSPVFNSCSCYLNTWPPGGSKSPEIKSL